MTVRVGVVGTGGISRSHLNGLAQTEDATVTVVQDLDLNSAAESAATCGAVATTSLDELLEHTDAVFICTPTATHRPILEQVVARGLAVFCEKPLAVDLVEAEAMGRAVEAAGVINQVGLPLRRRPPFAVLKHLMDDPRNGHLLAIEAHCLSRQRSRTTGGWRGDPALSGGGMLIEVGFHDLDLLQWFGGPIAAAVGRTTPGAVPGVEDAATVSLEFAAGGTAAFTAAWSDAPVPGQSRRVHAVFEHAEYVLDGSTLTAFGPGERQQSWDGAGLEAHAAELGVETNPQAAFVRAVRDGVAATPTVADAIEVHRVLDQVYARSHQPQQETPSQKESL